MRRTTHATMPALLLVLGLSAAASAAPAGVLIASTDLVPATATDEADDQPVTAAPDAATAAPSDPQGGIGTSPTPTTQDLAKQLAEVRAAYAAWRDGSAAGKMLALFAMLAAVTNFLLAMIKRAEAFVTNPDAKRWLPKIALGIGVLAAAFASLAAGQPPLVAVFYGLAPLVAVFAHEFLFPAKKTG